MSTKTRYRQGKPQKTQRCIDSLGKKYRENSESSAEDVRYRFDPCRHKLIDGNLTGDNPETLCTSKPPVLAQNEAGPCISSPVRQTTNAEIGKNRNMIYIATAKQNSSLTLGLETLVVMAWKSSYFR